jgi:DNA polymerase III delta subunit
MKILKNNIESLILNVKTSKFTAILLYGSDVGVVEARERDIKKKFADFESIKLDLNGENTLKDVLNEVLTPSFFGSPKFIQIAGNEGKMGDFDSFLTALKGFEGFVLITFYSNLDAKSKVRKVCEVVEEVGVIACYADEDADVMQVVQGFLRFNKLTIERDVLRWIVESFKNNRAVLLAELEKLAIFKREGKVTLAEAMALMQEEVEASIFEAVNHFFSLNLRDFLKEVEKLKEDVVPSVLVSSLINYTFKLLEILEEKEINKKMIDAILTEKGVFFKQIPKMKNHLSKWNLKMLNGFLGLLVELEIAVRKAQNNGYSLIEVELLKIIKNFS